METEKQGYYKAEPTGNSFELKGVITYEYRFVEGPRGRTIESSQSPGNDWDSPIFVKQAEGSP